MLLGTGVDIVSIEKFRQAVSKRGNRFINRIFTQAEIAYCNKKVNRIQHLAGRFACKEAISKALKMDWGNGLNWKEIEILNNRNGDPKIKLAGQVKRKASCLKVEDIQISLSHCPEYAVATAAILKRS